MGHTFLQLNVRCLQEAYLTTQSCVIHRSIPFSGRLYLVLGLRYCFMRSSFVEHKIVSSNDAGFSFLDSCMLISTKSSHAMPILDLMQSQSNHQAPDTVQCLNHDPTTKVRQGRCTHPVRCYLLWHACHILGNVLQPVQAHTVKLIIASLQHEQMQPPIDHNYWTNGQPYLLLNVLQHAPLLLFLLVFVALGSLVLPEWPLLLGFLFWVGPLPAILNLHCSGIASNWFRVFVMHIKDNNICTL